MSDLFKKWLDKNKIENEQTLKQLNVQQQGRAVQDNAVNVVNSRPSTSQGLSSVETSTTDPKPSTSTSSRTQEPVSVNLTGGARGAAASVTDPIPSTSRGITNVTDTDIRRNEENAKIVTNPNDLIFENEALKLTIVSAVHKQERKFRLSDHMWHLLLLPKKQSNKMPLLSDILNFLYVAFNFMLQQLKKFYDPKDKNIAFMTITQTSMLNGLNSGGFELHNDTSASEVVDRLLGMLNQYLISHQKLQLDRSFKVYLKVLSSEHSVQKKLTKVITKKKKINSRNYVGGNRRDQHIFPKLWGIDVQTNADSYLLNKCLLTCSLLGKLQNDFLKFGCKKFRIAQFVNSKLTKKQKYATKLLIEEVSQLIDSLKLCSTGPYELKTTIEKLANYWHCQFFLFTGVSQSKSKLSLMFPPSYDDTLMPIYLYKPHSQDHIIFIQNIDSYFRHNGKVCFGCKQAFKGSKYRHFCKVKLSCFTCHRYMQGPETYIHPRLKQFCNANISVEISTICPRCNCKILSQSCLQAHKLLCYSKGYFGWFCNECHLFTYSFKNLPSQEMKKRHVCGSFRNCRYCYLPQNIDHLCLIRQEKAQTFHSRLGFCQFQFSAQNNLVMAMILREEGLRGSFKKYIFLTQENSFEDKMFFYDYFLDRVNEKQSIFFKAKASKRSFDFTNNYDKLCRENSSIERDVLLHFLSDNENSSYIINDEENQIMVINYFLLLVLYAIGIDANLITVIMRVKHASYFKVVSAKP